MAQKDLKIKYRAVPGMFDILPNNQKYFHKVYTIVRNIAEFYGFREIATPILEPAELFSEGIGSSTQLVKHQLYSFNHKGETIALRPEQVTSLARAYIQDGISSHRRPVKLWYFGPFFRSEKPGIGRYCQFHQFGFEVLKEKHPVIDAQIIQIFYKILQQLKFKDLVVAVNSVGDYNCRPNYASILRQYLMPYKNSLCRSCRENLNKHPLRILNCRNEKCQEIISQAPQAIDHLCKGCHNHFKEVLEILDGLKIPYYLSPYLVGEFDYYTRTVFKFFPVSPASLELPVTSQMMQAEEVENLDAFPKQQASNSLQELESTELDSDYRQRFLDQPSSLVQSLVGGGRSDRLIERLGGKKTYAFGGSAGVERIISFMKNRAFRFHGFARPHIFLAQVSRLAKISSLELAEEFRQERIPVAEAFGRDSLREQLRLAGRMGVRFILILGQKEAQEGTIIVRSVESGKQKIVERKGIVKRMREELKK